MPEQEPKRWQTRLQEIIYESNTPAGKAFDVALLFLILASILVVMLDSVAEYHQQYGEVFKNIEWTLTIIFTIEYLLRLICIRRPLKYMVSFLGIIDLMAIIPTYLSLLLPAAHSLLVVRALRLLRVFRIFKLTHYLSEMEFLGAAVKGSLRKISIFTLIVLMLVTILGSLMYVIEEGKNGFTNIPTCLYWAIVTITTVGYGDISPVTPLGKFVASIIMLIGYSIIAVPTGILTTEMAMVAKNRKHKLEACPSCGREDHDGDAAFCKHCGSKL